MKLEFSSEIFEKYSNIKVHENSSSDSRVAPCGNIDGPMNRNITKLIVSVHNFAKAPKSVIEET
jgi:hypothetical protein